MAKCKNCKHLEYKDDGRERYVWCPLIGDNPDLEFERWCGAFKKMTNADRIRNMTDEELAEFIKDLSEHCLAGIGEVDCSKQITCENCKITALNWLKKEVER